MHDLVYIYPKSNVTVENCHIKDISYYLPNVLGALNKLKTNDVKVKSIVCDVIDDNLRDKIINTESKHYLIDLQDPFSLKEAEKAIRYCKYYHKESKVFLIGRFAIDLYKNNLLDATNVDFIFSSACEELLYFVMTKHFCDEIKLWPDNNYKLELSLYDHATLDTFERKSKVKRLISPLNIVLQKDINDITDCNISSLSDLSGYFDNAISYGYRRIKLDRDYLSQDIEFDQLENKDIEIEYSTNLFNHQISLEQAKIEKLSEKFTKVFVTLTGLEDDVIQLIDSIKEIENVRVNVLAADFYIRPEGKISTNINGEEIKNYISENKLGRTIKVLTEDIMLDYTDWELSEDVLNKLRKRF